jgi:transposase
MLEALLAGTTDPNELAQLARGSLRGKIPQPREALANRFELAHHGVLVSGLLAHIDALDQGIAALGTRIVEATEPHAELVELVSTIPGVKQRNAQVLIAECGTDMSIFRPCTTSPPGRGSAPATTSRQANTAPARPCAAHAGCGKP